MKTFKIKNKSNQIQKVNHVGAMIFIPPFRTTDSLGGEPERAVKDNKDLEVLEGEDV